LDSIIGLAGCELNMIGNSDHLDSLFVKGHFSVYSFSATDKNERKIFGADDLELSLKPSMLLAGSYIIDCIFLQDHI
jgi:hypothetical protein